MAWRPYRQGGAVPDPIFYAIQAMVGRRGVTVCKYVGRLIEMVFAVSPLHPGVGLIEIGLSFTTIIHSKSDENISDDPSSSSDDSDSEYGNNDDEIENEDASDYPLMHLRITLPEKVLFLSVCICYHVCHR